MFSEDYKRDVCLDNLDVGLDWNALIIIVKTLIVELVLAVISYFVVVFV